MSPKRAGSLQDPRSVGAVIEHAEPSHVASVDLRAREKDVLLGIDSAENLGHRGVCASRIVPLHPMPRADRGRAHLADEDAERMPGWIGEDVERLVVVIAAIEQQGRPQVEGSLTLDLEFLAGLHASVKV